MLLQNANINDYTQFYGLTLQMWAFIPDICNIKVLDSRFYPMSRSYMIKNI